METRPATLMLIFLGEHDTDSDRNVPLYEAVLQKLFDLGIHGASVYMGTMGFGANRLLHRRGLFGMTDERPVTISVVDDSERIRASIPELRRLIPTTTIFLSAGETVA